MQLGGLSWAGLGWTSLKLIKERLGQNNLDDAVVIPQVSRYDVNRECSLAAE